MTSLKQLASESDYNISFQTSNEFSQHIEMIACKDNLTYVEAIIEYCHVNKLEVEDIAKLCSQSLCDKMLENFRDLNYLPKQAKIDL